MLYSLEKIIQETNKIEIMWIFRKRKKKKRQSNVTEIVNKLIPVIITNYSKLLTEFVPAVMMILSFGAAQHRISPAGVSSHTKRALSIS